MVQLPPMLVDIIEKDYESIINVLDYFLTNRKELRVLNRYFVL